MVKEFCYIYMSPIYKIISYITEVHSNALSNLAIQFNKYHIYMKALT